MIFTKKKQSHMERVKTSYQQQIEGSPEENDNEMIRNSKRMNTWLIVIPSLVLLVILSLNQVGIIWIPLHPVLLLVLLAGIIVKHSGNHQSFVKRLQAIDKSRTIDRSIDPFYSKTEK